MVDSLGLPCILTPHVFAYAVPLLECHSTCCVLGLLQLCLHICFPLGETPTAGELPLACLLTKVFIYSLITTLSDGIVTICSHICSFAGFAPVSISEHILLGIFAGWNGMEWYFKEEVEYQMPRRLARTSSMFWQRSGWVYTVRSN